LEFETAKQQTAGGKRYIIAEVDEWGNRGVKQNIIH